MTAEDVVHSLKRTRSDPFTKQFQNISAVAGEAVVDKYTVRITTKEPTAPLLDYLFDRVIVTSKAIYDKYGPEVADKQHPVGAGPLQVQRTNSRAAAGHRQRQEPSDVEAISAGAR